MRIKKWFRINLSKEIIRCSFYRLCFQAFLSRIKLQTKKYIIIYITAQTKTKKLLNFLILINFHNSCLISTSITIIRCREYRNNILIMCLTIPIHNQLMRPTDHLQIIIMIKLFRDILSKCIPSPSRRYAPSTSFIRIRPY